jgi:hypothetical protein
VPTINDLPQAFIDEHHAWHHAGGHTGVEFLRFHGDFVRRVVEWYVGTGHNPADVQPWAEVPSQVRAVPGWDDIAPHVVRATNERAFEVPAPPGDFTASFADEEAFGRFVRDVVHDPFLHGAASVAFNEPILNDFHTSPRSTRFYRLHGMIEEWRQAFLHRAIHHRFSDHHSVQIWVETDVADPGIVDFVLTSAPWVTWWKHLILRDGLGGQWTIETKDGTHAASNALWADQVRNGQQLDFWHAGFLGFGAHLTSLGGLERLPPGSRITFRWQQDWPVE